MVVKILFIWEVKEDLQRYFKVKLTKYSEKEIELIFITPYSEEQAKFYVEEVDMIIGWRPKKEFLQKAKKAIVFNNPGAGVQHLIPVFRELNKERITPIYLCNCHGNAYFTAQHAVALLLAVTNKVINHHTWMKEGIWRTGDEEAQSIPLQKKTIGLLGYGAINQKVHRFMSGFEVKFAICKRSRDVNSMLGNNQIKIFTTSQLHEFLELVDILVIAIPITMETKKLLRREELELLGPEGIVINMARGDIIDQDDLFTVLQEKKIAGAGLDVWYNYNPEEKEGKKYPYDEKNAFHKLENVVLSPHRGASPMDNLERWDDVLYNIKQLVEGQREFKNKIDLKLEY